MHLYCFGDSITLGEYDTERGGWADRLKVDCLARAVAPNEPGYRVFNLGISGETTRKMRARLTTELGVRLDVVARSRVLLAYGANDAAESGGRLLVPLEEYVENLAWAIDEARRLTCDVSLVNVTPVAPAADGVRNRSGRLRSNAMVARYNDALGELSRRTAVALIDVNGAFEGRDLEPFFVADGVHPNAAGHALICDRVRACTLA
jgi:lysophospholipase L1-like esterase